NDFAALGTRLTTVRDARVLSEPCAVAGFSVAVVDFFTVWLNQMEIEVGVRLPGHGHHEHRLGLANARDTRHSAAAFAHVLAGCACRSRRRGAVLRAILSAAVSRLLSAVLPRLPKIISGAAMLVRVELAGIGWGHDLRSVA